MKFIILKMKYIYLFTTALILFSLSFGVYAYVNTSNSYNFKDLYNEFKDYSYVNLSNIENIYQTNNDEKIAYLTFDDGPTKRSTPKILDILNKNDIKATFFVVGYRVEQFPDIVKRAYEEGHYIANHTYSHTNNIYKSREAFLNDILKNEKVIGQAIGVDNYFSHIFRFPNGSKTHSEYKKKCLEYLKELNYIYLDWNCLNNDAISKTSDYQLLKNLKNSSKNKNNLVILMHDSGDVNKTYTVLQDSIDYLKSEGYCFKTLYDLIS